MNADDVSLSFKETVIYVSIMIKFPSNLSVALIYQPDLQASIKETNSSQTFLLQFLFPWHYSQEKSAQTDFAIRFSGCKFMITLIFLLELVLTQSPQSTCMGFEN